MASRKGGVTAAPLKSLPGAPVHQAPKRGRSTTIAPWEDPPNELEDNIAPWQADPQSRITGTRPFNQSYFNDSPDREGIPPPVRPSNSRVNSDNTPDGDAEARRPSLASDLSVSSIGSKGSASNGRFHHKSLKGFFGDDPNNDSRKNSQVQLSSDSQLGPDDKAIRSNSVQTGGSQDRPKTPIPSSDVTPWDYQNFDDVSNFGSAPIRPELRTDANGTVKSTNSHKRGLLHRHTKSKDDPPKGPSLAPSSVPQRPATSRESSVNNLPFSLRGTPNSNTPTASTQNLAKTPTSQPGSKQELPAYAEKKGLFGRLKAKARQHASSVSPAVSDPVTPPENDADQLQPLPEPTGRRRATSAKSDKKSLLAGSFSELSSEKKDRESSVASVDSASTIKPSPDLSMPKMDRTFTGASMTSKASKFSMRHGKHRERGMSYLNGPRDNAGDALNQAPMQAGIFNLDTNFDDMSDIVKQPNAIKENDAPAENQKGIPQTPAQEQGAPAWDAPDSWAVKGQDADTQNPHGEVADKGLPSIEEEDGISYFMRVFRSDGTFATLSMTINATVGEVLQSLAKKSVLHDTIDNYHLLLRKHQLSRQLDHKERPIAMQKRLLVQAGYQESDHIEEVGREDNSYLCRFTFSHEKQTGFGSSLENDLTFNKQQKFSHVDLSGRSLITIPITLYTKASEIISLNLSKNLALSVPKDFISACINLREIKFTSNEAWRLPASLAWASRLTVLDLSNNRLDDLSHVELHRLTSLVSLKLANNTLSTLPTNYTHFRSLRSLNISSNSFEEFPEHLYNLRSLVDLDISFNKITDLPKISSLTTLERLWMTNNYLKGPFNEGFTKLKNLKEIDARFNYITNIDNVTGLPNLEQLLVGHNNISAFKGSFQKMRNLVMDHCPVTGFDLEEPVPTLSSLNIASAKLVEFKDGIFEMMPNLQKLILDKNHFSSIPAQIGRLSKLEHLSMAKNRLSMIPPSIGSLVELKFLNLRECNVKSLPPEIWYCRKLEMLNLSTNVLETFPKMNAAPPPELKETTPVQTPGLSHSPSFEELGKLEDFQARRPSQTSGGMLGSSPNGRKNSIASMYSSQGRKMSAISRTNTEYSFTTATRKDSNISQARLQNTFAGSLRYLYLADNRLEDEVFRELVHLQELRMLNLSYNEIDDFPQGVLRRWPQLTDLYLSGNTLTSLPSDDLEESSNLRQLYLNANRFQVLPAELCNVHKLSVLDVGSNSLKYNVSNWPYDWNWNRNSNLKYLNFSANRRLEIKPAAHNTQNQFAAMNAGEVQDLTSFNSLKYLRVLGLMDVTLLTNTVPDDNEDRRVRTSASLAGSLMYGMADTLGKNDHLSTLDLLKPNFRGHESEIIVGMFDGQSLSSGGSKVAKYLHENFGTTLRKQLDQAEESKETPIDALRRTFLTLNKDMANYASSAIENREHRLANGHRGSTVANLLSSDDLNAGCVATVLYLNGTDLYIANVGDIEAVLIQTNGQSHFLTEKHQPAEMRERERIREAGGYVSRQGKLNDTLEVSRAFGFFNAMPSVIAAPSTRTHQLTESDELIVMASKEFWDFVTVDLAIDLARAEKADLMIAAQKLRDLAMAFGARDKMMVQVLGVSDLRKRHGNRFRGTSLSLAREIGSSEDQIFPSSRKKKGRGDLAADSKLARLEEPEAPVGDVAIVFTDIKNSTALWEILPVPMRGAIQMHNELMRRQLRILGGYEVKTEGDAFMCSFATATSALLWCFSCQSHLLELPWPTEILDTVHCREKFDRESNPIYRGLSVRMGMHWGKPVCEQDPITRRMDYFGPMVNKAARVSAVADGGQITVSTDFLAEVRRTLEATSEDDERRDSVGSADTSDDPFLAQIRRELRSLSSQGFEVKDLGEKKLKGLENPEFISLMYPHSLAGRLEIPPGAGDQPGNAAPENANKEAQPGTLDKDSVLSQGLDLDEVWKLWDVALRLEMLCSCLEDKDNTTGLKKPELSLLTVMKERGGMMSDTFMLNLMEHQVTRVENCVSALQLRHMLKPFQKGVQLSQQAVPVQELMAQVGEALQAFREMKAKS